MVNDEGLKQTIEKHGFVVSAKVILESGTSRSRGYGFVEIEHSDDASKAIRELNNSEIDGRNIIVNEVKGRTQIDIMLLVLMRIVLRRLL